MDDINSILSFELVALICEYHPPYPLGFASQKFKWRYLILRVYGCDYYESIIETDIKSTYIDKCTWKKIVHNGFHIIKKIFSVSGGCKLVGRGDNGHGQLGLGSKSFINKLREINDISCPENVC